MTDKTVEQILNEITIPSVTIDDNTRNSIKQEQSGLFKSIQSMFPNNVPQDKQVYISNILSNYIIYIINKNKLSKSSNVVDKIDNLSAMTDTIKKILTDMKNVLIPPATGGRLTKKYSSRIGGSLQQVYNAQGLVTDLAATNDQISGATNAPPAFSAGHTTEAISFDMLSESMLNALTPKLSTAGGAWPSSKKASKKSKH